MRCVRETRYASAGRVRRSCVCARSLYYPEGINARDLREGLEVVELLKDSLLRDPVLVDEDTDALQAMSTSWEMMRGAKLQMFKINACMSILTFGGMLLCLVGMIPVIMVWALVPVVVYEHLRQTQAHHQEF